MHSIDQSVIVCRIARTAACYFMNQNLSAFKPSWDKDEIATARHIDGLEPARLQRTSTRHVSGIFVQGFYDPLVPSWPKSAKQMQTTLRVCPTPEFICARADIFSQYRQIAEGFGSRLETARGKFPCRDLASCRHAGASLDRRNISLALLTTNLLARHDTEHHRQFAFLQSTVAHLSSMAMSLAM